MKYRVLTIVNKYIIWFVIIILIVLSSIFSDVFFTTQNLFNILRQISILGLLAIGVTFVFIGGSFDLSIGSIMMFSTVLAINIQPVDNIHTIMAIIIALAIGIILGCVNGFLIGYLKGNAFIITLAMLSLILGIILFYTGGKHVWTFNVTQAFSFISEGEIFRIPFPAILFLLSIFITNFVLSKTPFGMRLYALGNNEVAAKISGIKVSKMRFTSFVISGFFAALSGIIVASRVKNIDPGTGTGYTFDAITALILGGVSLFGGKGNMFQTLSGVLLMGILANSMTLIGVKFDIQMVIRGLLLIVAVYSDVLTRKINYEYIISKG